jgi:ribosome-associated protein
MREFYLKDDFIKLGQLLKAAGLCASGVDAKYDIQNGEVKLNGNVEIQRGKKIVAGDVIEYKGNSLVVKKKEN